MSDVLPAFGSAVKALRVRMDRLLREHGLRLGQFQVLRELWVRDGQTPRELAAAGGVEMPTVTRTVQRMVRDGLVVRESNPDDARSVRIRLTDRGRAMETVATAVRDRVTELALLGFSAEREAAFRRALEQITANLRE